MDPSLLGQAGSIADKITSLTLVLAWAVAGGRKVWAWGYQLTEKDAQITELKNKVSAQERLIDRLSGMTDRSTQLSTAAMVALHQLRGDDQ